MSGHLRKRGNKWYYSFETSSVDGKRKRIERVGGRTKKEAQQALRIALMEYENAGTHFDPVNMSLSDFLDYWFKNYVEMNLKYNTQIAYKNFIEKHFKPALGMYNLNSLTPIVLQDFINNKFLTGMSKSHLTNMIATLSSILKYAVHPSGFLKDNPMQYVRYPKFKHKKSEANERVITHEEIKEILERFPEGSPHHIPIVIAYHTGLRIGEVMGLTWQDIDLEKNTLDVNKIIINREGSWYFEDPKTPTSVRNVKIGKTLSDILKRHKKEQMKNKLKYGIHFTQTYILEETRGNETLRNLVEFPVKLDAGTMQAINLVCSKENGEMVTPNTFKYASRVINHTLNIQFNFHSLRHTHATMLIENGAKIKDVQVRLGHKNIETTLNKYTHSTEVMAEESVDIFESAISKDLPTGN